MINPEMTYTPSRRQFVGLLGAATAGLAIGRAAPASAASPSASPATGLLSSNQYPWHTFYQRTGRSFEADLASALDEVAASGADALEPNMTSEALVDTYADVLKERGLRMPSIYMNCLLHDASQAESSMQRALAIARRAQARCETRIIVINPTPISWTGPENKSDQELLVQAERLDQLGAALRKEGMDLAYHNHDSEFRLGAREFHHMLAATDPNNVKLCLDAHWIYRGAGNSSVALFDILSLYGDRVVELHVRQSREGIWTETFGDGDIDYPRVVDGLQAKGLRPLVVAEQSVEKATPATLDALAAHKITHQQIRKTFAPFL